jgi:hypothetical protein
MSEYTFKLPISGKVIGWSPLKVGDELKLSQRLPGEANRSRLGIELYLSRVALVDGKPGPVQQSEWETWDVDDFAAFREEVDVKEAARRAAFRRKRDPNEVKIGSEEVQYHIEQVEAAVSALAVALRDARESIILAEQQRPLDPAKSP